MVACFPLSGCSPPKTSNVKSNGSPPEPADQTVDVIVVGAGISGLSTALDLGRGGAKVTVIDMASVFGGHAVMSQGSVSIVASPAQERAGIQDSPDLAFQDFHRWGEDPDSVKKADMLEQLAELAGLPAKNLVETVARYNELVEQGEDKDFGRFGPGKPEFSNKASSKIAKPPFYAMQTFPLTRKSMGGVAIDLQCRVLDKQKQSIPGLYAVGELTGLAGINGKAALKGTFLGPCIATGRVAARSLLKELAVPARPAAASESRCVACHDIPELLSQAREGYWHFDKVHRTIQERSIDCRHCHSELTPYRVDAHRMNRQSLTASCVLCHVAQE